MFNVLFLRRVENSFPDANIYAKSRNMGTKIFFKYWRIFDLGPISLFKCIKPNLK